MAEDEQWKEIPVINDTYDSSSEDDSSDTLYQQLHGYTHIPTELPDNEESLHNNCTPIAESADTEETSTTLHRVEATGTVLECILGRI